MDFEIRYTEAQQQFRQEVAEWLDANVPPALRERRDWDHVSYETYLAQREFGRRLGGRGWLYPSAPREYGGGGLDMDATLILMEEVHSRGLRLPPYYDSGGILGNVAILVWGTEEQKRKYLPPIYKGEVRTFQLLTEPAAGSDLASVQATAVRDGDDYVVNGQKIYIGTDHGADMLWTIVRTSTEAPRHENLSWFMIDADAPGVTMQPMRLMGDNHSQKNFIFLDNVRVPEIALIGGENNGWKVAGTHLELEHGFGFNNLGQTGKRQMKALLSYCQETTRNGQRLIDDPILRDLLAQAYIKHEIGRLWGMRNFWLTRMKTQSYEGAQASYFMKNTGLWMNHVVADVIGPRGLVWSEGDGVSDGSLALSLASAIGNHHAGGTTDIQRVVMARRLGIGRASAESGAALA
jgi:alkylation response protein AidB-like acyl-CoA dehydrogenase